MSPFSLALRASHDNLGRFPAVGVTSRGALLLIVFVASRGLSFRSIRAMRFTTTGEFLRDGGDGLLDRAKPVGQTGRAGLKDQR